MTLDELFVKCATRNPKDGPLELPREEWTALYLAMEKRRQDEYKTFLSAPIDRPNFLCGAIPVVPQ
jgi:hypothetical protein